MRDGKPTVLIVDDEIDMRLLVRVILEGADLGIEVVGEAEDGLAALAVFGGERLIVAGLLTDRLRLRVTG